MLYEKKMLILSGEGKGVVLIEKSARGVRFSLNTFDMPICGELKVGVITPRDVFVRDLPQKDNPSLVFILDVKSLNDLHFAVFDTKLRLYGTNGKRMWESNVMDLLVKSDRRMPQEDDRVPIAPLPPIAKPPRELPMPDGTGIPQSRLELYGDEAIADTDFYTPLDLSARMPIVDRFLDAPRVLEELAPRIAPHSVETETTAADDDEIEVDPASEIKGLQESDEIADEAEHFSAQEDDTEQHEKQDEPVVKTEPAAEITQQSEIPTEPKAVAQSEHGSLVEEKEVKNDMSERTADGNGDELYDAAATLEYADDRPWAMQARYLRRRSGRPIEQKKVELKVLQPAERVKQIREPSFTELAKADIDKLFGAAPKDDELNRLLPDIEWVRVETDGNVISVGRGGNEFLCYAVAGTYRKLSPLGEHSQWLPSNRAVPTGKGYWLIFQSQTTGEIIESN